MFVFVIQLNLCKTAILKMTEKIVFQDQLSLNPGQKYCSVLQGVYSAILLTFIKLPFVIEIFVLSILRGSITQVLVCFLLFLAA